MEEDELAIAGQLSQLRVFGRPTLQDVRRAFVTILHHNQMEGLAQDLNSALEESTRSSASSASSKRRLLRRRCKSSSNLATFMAVAKKLGDPQLSSPHDSSTSSLEDNLTRNLSTRGERGTSSLQLSDSDENVSMAVCPNAHSSRKKRSESWNSNRTSRGNAESDSVNENVSPVRPNTKRKRKFKRMAIDPAGSGIATISRSPQVRISETAPATPIGTMKRKKAKNKLISPDTPIMRVTAPPSSPKHVSKPSTSTRQRQTSGVIPGKRKRSTREKSVETESSQKLGNLVQGSSQLSMDVDEEHRSSSSLSSSEWEDQESEDEGQKCFDDGEADDEQSDWHDCSTGPVFCLTDDEDSNDLPTNLFAPEGTDDDLQIENFNKLTSTARQAYLARMKRLAECVPGREIRAGTRRIRSHQSGFTIKSSSSEQLSRFLQDSSRTKLRLSVSRGSDRHKIVHLANLYSLSLECEDPHLLVLSKTGRTVKVDEFLVPQTPSLKQPIEVKRRRRTPPATTTMPESHVQMEEEEPDKNS